MADRRDARTGHAVRMMRCERCGILSWRWAPLPDGSSAVLGDLATPGPRAARAALAPVETATG